MIEEIKYKIVRLNTGEDIIGACLIDDDNSCISIENPMKVYIKRMANANKTMLVMMPWLPLEIIDDDFATINYQDIITVLDPKESFIEYYTSMVEQFEARMKLADDSIEQEDDEDDEMDDSTLQDMLDSLKETKRGRLH
jgi:hypothetical protein